MGVWTGGSHRASVEWLEMKMYALQSQSYYVQLALDRIRQLRSSHNSK